MAHTTCLVVNVNYVGDCSKNIGSQSWHIDLFYLPFFGRLLNDPASLPRFVNVPATITHSCSSGFFVS